MKKQETKAKNEKLFGVMVNVFAAIILVACIGLGLWNYFQDRAIGNVEETVEKADSLANSAVSVAGKAENKAKSALSTSRNASRKTEKSFEKSENALKGSEQAGEEAKKAQTGWGHDMVARRAVYRLVVQQYCEAGYSLDSAKILAKRFVVNPKRWEDHFYSARLKKADSLLENSLATDSLATDSLGAAK